jgi:purine-nucleoside phosphorylase
MLKGWGIDAVGMSTVPEVIALRHMGKRVAGLSCIANPAAGLGPKKPDHEAGTAFVASRIDSLVGLIEEFNRGLNRSI